MASPTPSSRPERDRRTSTRTRIVLGSVVLIGAIALLVLITLGPARDREVSNLGDDVFDLGNTTRIATEIDDRGPILFPDPVGGDRPIWVNHLSPQVDTGWVAFAAVAPAPPDDCQVDWDADANQFVACDGRTFGEDGAGLEQYVVEVDGSVVSIDLNFAERNELDGGAGDGDGE